VERSGRGGEILQDKKRKCAEPEEAGKKHGGWEVAGSSREVAGWGRTFAEVKETLCVVTGRWTTAGSNYSFVRKPRWPHFLRNAIYIKIVSKPWWYCDVLRLGLRWWSERWMLDVILVRTSAHWASVKCRSVDLQQSRQTPYSRATLKIWHSSGGAHHVERRRRLLWYVISLRSAGKSPAPIGILCRKRSSCHLFTCSPSSEVATVAPIVSSCARTSKIWFPNPWTTLSLGHPQLHLVPLKNRLVNN